MCTNGRPRQIKSIVRDPSVDDGENQQSIDEPDRLQRPYEILMPLGVRRSTVNAQHVHAFVFVRYSGNIPGVAD